MNTNKSPAIFMLIALFGIFISTTAHSAGEATYVHVSDMSLIHYQLTGDGKVYFRNLNSFNNAVTGCCYAFYLDTTTPYGKSAWSTILAKMATKQNLYLYVTESNPPTSGAPAQISP